MEIIDDQCRDWKKTQLTGFFRDGVRRIDLIMVTKDNPVEEVEHVKMDFLINTMNAGFELEIETGMRDRHRHLLFIKVHAPDHIVKHFGYYYNIRKYFKDSHLKYVSSAVKDETNLVKVVRRVSPGPLNYSTLERSLITYKVLQAMTFGEPKNFIGIQRLLDHNILLDVYPLHDGPYFLTKFQKPAEFHGRQALFYNWVGYRNLSRWQPIHLIREYLGERMAFLFAFFEYCNITLAITGLFGVIMFIVGILTKDDREKKIVNKYDKKPNTHVFMEKNTATKYNDLPVCPKCKDFVACPFRYMEDYTGENKTKLALDFPYNIAYAYFVVMATLLLYVLWRRRENYLSWLWEVDEHYEKRMPRPEHLHEPPVPGRVVHAVKNKRLYAFFRRINLTSIMRKINEFGVLVLILVAFFVTYLPAMISVSLTSLNRIRYVEEEIRVLKVGYQQHVLNLIVVGLLGLVNGSCIMLMENLWIIVAKRLSESLNPRTHKAYEKYHIFKTFGMTVVINFGLIFFYAFFKGALYTYPSDMDRWNMPLSLGMWNCGMLPCIDEVFVIYITTFLSKRIYNEFALLLERWRYKRDVYPLDDGYVDIPSWEREYELYPINQHYIMDRFNEIFINMCIGTFFASIVPFWGFVVFIFNVWDIRFWAKYLIVHSRRPLIQQTWGLSSWKYVLLFLPFAAAFVNVRVCLSLSAH
ncbi:anoctamin-4-like [Pectinophora gossypiella]|uniref:anoctamin-4-like n=1 Tax=Pectinophora gossypiella TaxID=13191 RepID=UPI00214E04EE|nr:anoctamin-4-like [Pectinophora gossypiella]